MRYIFKSLFAVFVSAIAVTASAQNYEAIHTSKEAISNADGTYTLKLETFVEGEASTETTVVKTTNPVDFVLCLDVSGSMRDPLKNSTVQATYNLVYNNMDRLDKTRGEGYYACTDGLFGVIGVQSYPVRYYNNNWQRNSKSDGSGSWTNIKGSTSLLNSVNIYKSKIGALMDACDAFLDKIESSQADGSLNGSNGHKVGVITFAGAAVNLTSGLISINSRASISSKIHSLTVGGATAADYGMEAAINLLSLNASGNGRSKALVLFTDGEPNHGSGFDKTVANKCITLAKGAKDKNAKIFSINVYEQTAENSDMWKYMNYVSSNYPNATSLTVSGTMDSNKFYHLATNENALNAAFEAVATEAVSNNGGAGVDLNVSEVTLRDVVTSSFVIPKGAESVRAYEVPVLTTVPSSHALNDIRFATVSESEKVQPSSVNITVENNVVDVTGFNFSAKWVGYKITKKNGVSTYAVNPTGAKLVIEIVIAPDPNDEGGYVYTNETSSGVYVGDLQVTTNNKKPYERPDAVFTPMDLKIQKSGLQAGESVLYTVTRSGDSRFSLDVILTADENGVASTTVAKVPVKDERGSFYEYIVTEDNSWDWAYKETTQPVKHTLGTLDTTAKTFDKNNLFVVPSSSSSTSGTAVIHAEDYKTNKFAK